MPGTKVGATYYIQVKYTPEVLIGTPVPNYETNTYTWYTTTANKVSMDVKFKGEAPPLLVPMQLVEPLAPAVVVPEAVIVPEELIVPEEVVTEHKQKK